MKIRSLLATGLAACYLLTGGTSVAFAQEYQMISGVEDCAAAGIQKQVLYIGKSIQLEIPKNTKKWIWKSSNGKVAKVNKKGKVTALKAGTVTVTAKAGKKVYTYAIIVKKWIALKKISFNQSKLKIETGEKVKLKLSYFPTNTTEEKKITWQSANSDIVSVDKKGNLTAKKAGKTKITAKIGTKQANCVVTVETSQQAETTNGEAFAQLSEVKESSDQPIEVSKAEVSEQRAEVSKAEVGEQRAEVSKAEVSEQTAEVSKVEMSKQPAEVSEVGVSEQKSETSEVEHPQQLSEIKKPSKQTSQTERSSGSSSQEKNSSEQPSEAKPSENAKEVEYRYVVPDADVLSEEVKQQLKAALNETVLKQWFQENAELDENYIVPIYQITEQDLGEANFKEKLKFEKQYAVLINCYQPTFHTQIGILSENQGAWKLSGVASWGDDWSCAINSLPKGKTYYVQVQGHSLWNFFAVCEGQSSVLYTNLGGNAGYGTKMTPEEYSKKMQDEEKKTTDTVHITEVPLDDTQPSEQDILSRCDSQIINLN